VFEASGEIENQAKRKTMGEKGFYWKSKRQVPEVTVDYEA